MKTIYLHIGYGKTGTSSIQSFLARNRERLLELGILYPVAGLTYDGFKSHSHHGLAVFQKSEIPEDVLHLYSDLLDEIESSQQNTVIISSEHFCFIKKEYLHQLKKLLSNYKIKIIFYVRNQANLIESTFLQWQKVGWNYSGEIEKFYKEHRAGFNFLQIIQPWTEEFDARNIITRIYDRRTTGNDICVDFLKIFEIDKKITPDNIRANPSLLPDLSQLLNIIDQCEIKDNQRDAVIHELLKLSETFKSHSSMKLINTKLQKEIEEYYEAANKSFALQFLTPEESIIFLNT